MSDSHYCPTCQGVGPTYPVSENLTKPDEDFTMEVTFVKCSECHGVLFQLTKDDSNA